MAERRVLDKAGSAVGEDILRKIESAVLGKILRPGDEDYEVARKVWNGMIDRHPSMILYCTGVEDVRRAVDFAMANNVLVAVRGGGHNVAGNAVCDGGLVIDISGMKRIAINSESGIACARQASLGESALCVLNIVSRWKDRAESDNT